MLKAYCNIGITMATQQQQTYDEEFHSDEEEFTQNDDIDEVEEEQLPNSEKIIKKMKCY